MLTELFNAFPYIGAVAAGLLSFLSPCVLPLIPSYLSFITGISFKDLQHGDNSSRIRFITIVNSLLFILGFSIIFIALGASSSLLGSILFNYKDWLRIGGGILIIFFGFLVAGVIKVDFLLHDSRFHLRNRPAGYVGTVAVGMAFAAGWTPCIGPVLGSILLYAGSTGSTFTGVKLLAMYSVGLAIPFLFSAFAFNTFLNYSARLRKYMRFIMIINGLLLTGFGILLLTDKLTWLTSIFSYSLPAF